MKPNVLVMQSGGSTSVFNQSLYGVVHESSLSGQIGTVYGAIHGLDGLLDNQLIDLSKQSPTVLNKVAQTPGGALGSTRRKLEQNDIPTVMGSLRDNKIRFCFIIGGNDSAETALGLYQASINTPDPLSVIHIPKTIDNDLAETDHSPGYGSAARFIALATMGAGRDAETMGPASPITVIEVMGRDAGWLAAAAALGKREEKDAPHAVCVPEFPVNKERFQQIIESAYHRFGFAVAIVSENARGTDGVLGNEKDPWYVDDFGHAYHRGAGYFLASLIRRNLDVRVRYEIPGSIQRSMINCISDIDAKEAEYVGRSAVRYALDGIKEGMVGLVRCTGSNYKCTSTINPLGKIVGKVKKLSPKHIDSFNFQPTQSFIDYAIPLIGEPLPMFNRFSILD